MNNWQCDQLRLLELRLRAPDYRTQFPCRKHIDQQRNIDKHKTYRKRRKLKQQHRAYAQIQKIYIRNKTYDSSPTMPWNSTTHTKQHKTSQSCKATPRNATQCSGNLCVKIVRRITCVKIVQALLV